MTERQGLNLSSYRQSANASALTHPTLEEKKLAFEKQRFYAEIEERQRDRQERRDELERDRQIRIEEREAQNKLELETFRLMMDIVSRKLEN